MLILMHGLPAPKLVVLLDMGLTGPQQSVLSQLIYAKDKYTYILQLVTLLCSNTFTFVLQ